MAKMGYKMVALCAAAVGIIYSTGYIVTEPSIANGAQTLPTVTASTANTQHSLKAAPKKTTGQDNSKTSSGTDQKQNASSSSSATDQSRNASSSSSATNQSQNNSSSSSATNQSQNNSSSSSATNQSQNNSSSSSATNQGQYRDGTYYGEGSNRIGGVAVAVTVKQGKIASVQITQCTTHYRQSVIDPVLPNQVVAQQNGNVNFVTGATRSSEDFQTAVQQALQQAQN